MGVGIKFAEERCPVCNRMVPVRRPSEFFLVMSAGTTTLLFVSHEWRVEFGGGLCPRSGMTARRLTELELVALAEGT